MANEDLTSDDNLLDPARARILVEELIQGVRDAIEEANVGVGFIFMGVGPPYKIDDEGNLTQEFFFSSNSSEVGSIVGLMGRGLEQIARTESKRKIIVPETEGMPN